MCQWCGGHVQGAPPLPRARVVADAPLDRYRAPARSVTDRPPSTARADPRRTARRVVPGNLERGDAAILMASGVYSGGTEALLPGCRYGLAVREEQLHVLGPLDTTPDRVALRKPLKAIRASVIDGRLLIAAAASEPTRLVMSFGAVVGLDADELESVLNAGSTDQGSRIRR